MQKKIYKRLSDLEKELYRDVWADVTCKDGTQKRIKMLDVLSLCTTAIDSRCIICRKYI